MTKKIILAAIVGFVLGAITLGLVTSSTAQVIQGVHASKFQDGTVCYTNNAGGIFCIR